MRVDRNNETGLTMKIPTVAEARAAVASHWLTRPDMYDVVARQKWAEEHESLLMRLRLAEGPSVWIDVPLPDAIPPAPKRKPFNRGAGNGKNGRPRTSNVSDARREADRVRKAKREAA